MNNQEYIRKAAEILGWEMDADGWLYPPRDEVWGSLPSHVHWSWKWVQDIIAAQLVRQVDALGPLECDVTAATTWIYCPSNDDASHPAVIGKDRTMNTLRAIVDSGVLKSE